MEGVFVSGQIDKSRPWPVTVLFPDIVWQRQLQISEEIQILHNTHEEVAAEVNDVSHAILSDINAPAGNAIVAADDTDILADDDNSMVAGADNDLDSADDNDLADDSDSEEEGGELGSYADIPGINKHSIFAFGYTSRS